jgi:16S rRNA (cytidine1402-2'-O)-methyltransferase
LSGQLILVATPIGNLGDFSERARIALHESAAICCEDTRRTGMLLQRFGITAGRYIVLNEHTEVDKIPQVLRLLAEGSDITVVSDAGSPGISDPGERLVRAALDAGHPVSAVPGPSAVVMALSISGLPSGRFVFEGFLPRSGSGRTERLSEIAREQRTMVLYEAPHRLLKTVTELAAACGDERQVVIARELTKMHEEVWRGTLGEAVARAGVADPIGEHVLVLAGAPIAGPATDDDVRIALRNRLAGGLDKKTAIAEVTTELKVAKRTVYAIALELDAARRTPVGAPPSAH